MKCFINDNDWQGAEIYFSEDKQKFANILRSNNLKWFCHLMNTHNIEKNGLNAYLEYYKQIDYWNNTSNFINDENVIREYDIFEGQSISTTGGG